MEDQLKLTIQQLLGLCLGLTKVERNDPEKNTQAGPGCSHPEARRG